MIEDTTLELDNFFATIQNPYPVYAYLREHDPVRWNDMFGCYMLSKYDDVHMAFSDHRRFSSDIWTNVPERLMEMGINEEIDSLRQIIPFLAYNLQGMDPPNHTRQRTLMQKTFTPRMIESFRPTVQKLVDELIDQKLSEGRMDLVADLAYPLPSNVILDLLSIPRSGRPYIRASSEAINEFVATILFSGPQVWPRLAGVFADVKAYLKSLIAERRQHPGPDLLTKMVHAEENGDMLSEDEIVIATNFLLFAGHETTANLIAVGMYYLMQNPDQMEELRANPGLIPGAVEELLRYVSPVHTLARRTTQEVTIRGVTIPENNSIYLLVGAANRDPEKFPDPERLDIHRNPTRTLGFGHGIHYCIGAALARLESQVAFETILRRLPNIHMVGDPPMFRPNYSLRGLIDLQVAFG
ncbi:MAG TPA: cytochrome P450 [Ktedonobacteraceae bacterium]|jgi:cytochrome P450|nr:cytochrome P450 [Ktedonobacteraceae bacterium]